MTKFPIEILFRPLLVSGSLATKDNTTLFSSTLLIMINDEQPRDQQVVALWHETVHLLLMAAGIEAPHDEAWVEETARKLAKACPEILDIMGRP